MTSIIVKAIVIMVDIKIFFIVVMIKIATEGNHFLILKNSKDCQLVYEGNMSPKHMGQFLQGGKIGRLMSFFF